MSILSAAKGIAGVASLANPIGFANAGVAAATVDIFINYYA